MSKKRKKKDGRVVPMTWETFDAVVDMLEEFLTTTPQLVKLAKFDRAKVVELLNRIAEHPDGNVVLVATHKGKPVGCVVLVTVPIWYSNDTVAQELAWWVSPEARGLGAGAALLKAAEEWSGKCGAPVLIMGAVNGSSELARHYVNKGYKLSESTYAKFFEQSAEVANA